MAGFKSIVCYFTVLLVISFSVVLSESSKQRGVFLSHTCVTFLPATANKPPVILLHGLTGFKEAWRGILEPLVFLTRRRVCSYDARNHGNSDWSDTFNIDVLAEDLGNLMTKLKIKKAALVGHSLGGLTVMKFALKNPEKVEHLVVEDIAPSVSKILAEIMRLGFKVLLDSLSAIPAGADEEAAKKAVTDYVVKLTGIPPAENLFPLRLRNGVWQWKFNVAVFVKALENPDAFIGKMEGQYNGRALFIYGTASPFKVNEQEEAIKKLFPKAELFPVEGAGHVVQANRTIYVDTVVKFLNGRGS